MDLPIYGTWPPWPLVSSSEKGRWENHLTSLIGLQREENEAKVVKWYQSLKEISPGCSLEGMMLKLKLQYFGYLMWRVDSLEKTLMLGSDAGRYWGQEEKETTEDEMAGWHHWIVGREFEWTPGVSDGQGGLACCNSWGCKESDTTERLNWTEWYTVNAVLFKCLWTNVYKSIIIVGVHL